MFFRTLSLCCSLSIMFQLKAKETDERIEADVEGSTSGYDSDLEEVQKSKGELN